MAQHGSAHAGRDFRTPNTTASDLSIMERCIWCCKKNIPVTVIVCTTSWCWEERIAEFTGGASAITHPGRPGS
jgi:hypothetical protein